MALLGRAKITTSHISKLRLAMDKLGCQLGLLANFYGIQVKVKFVRVK